MVDPLPLEVEGSSSTLIEVENVSWKRILSSVFIVVLNVIMLSIVLPSVVAP